MDIYLERPAIITPFAEGTEEAPGASAIVANSGATTSASNPSRTGPVTRPN